MNEPLHLDLFSGIGGFAMAAQACGFRTIAFCEIEPYAQEILIKNFNATLAHPERVWKSQPIRSLQDFRRWAIYEGKESNVSYSMSAGQWWNKREGEDAFHPPIFHDIKELRGSDFPAIDLLTGGYPCQPFSHAGKRNGENDDRHLWPEIARLLREMDAAAGLPTWVLLENVAGHITMGLDAVLSELESIGYSCAPPLVIPACAVDAKHRRDRVWILANARSKRGERLRDESRITSEVRQGGACGSENSIQGALADSERIGRPGQGGGFTTQQSRDESKSGSRSDYP